MGRIHTEGFLRGKGLWQIEDWIKGGQDTEAFLSRNKNL